MQHELWPTLSIMCGGGIHRCDRDCYHTAKRVPSKKSPGNPGRSTGLRKGRLSHATASHGPMLTELGRVLQRGSRLGEWASFKRPRLGERVLASADGDGGQGRRR